MTRCVSIMCVVLLCHVLSACAPMGAGRMDDVHDTPPTRLPPWIAARTFYLDNGALKLGVCPDVGRIVWCGRSATAENLLWLNDAPGTLTDRAEHGWPNWGGDKVWPAPQVDWKGVMGWRWPPDPVLDGLAWRVIERQPLSCVIESRPSPYWGVAIRRQITLDPERPVVAIHNTLTRVAASDHRIHVWAVTQARPPKFCLLDTANSLEISWRWLSTAPEGSLAQSTVRPLQNAVCYAPPAEQSTKIGTRGRWIASIYVDVIFLQRTAEPAVGGLYADDAPVQAYGGDTYVEMELLSPIEFPRLGQSVEQVVFWQLIDRRPEDEAAEQVLQRINVALTEH